MSTARRTKIKEVNRKFFALDFDRTLGDTNAIAGSLVEFLGVNYPHLAAIIEEGRAEIESTGGSYDVWAALQLHSGLDVGSLIDEFIQQHEDSERFLMPGAKELLEAIDLAGEWWGIVTYGGEDWQRTKLQLSGLSTQPTLIIDTHQKGRLLASWYDNSGQYKIPDELGGGEANELILVDDKASAFDGLPVSSAVRGYWLRRGGPPLLSQRGSVPPHVTAITSLMKVVRDESL